MYACDVLLHYGHVAVAVELAHCLHTLPRVHRSVAMLRIVAVLSVVRHAWLLPFCRVVAVSYDHLHEVVIESRQVVDVSLHSLVLDDVLVLLILFRSVGTWDVKCHVVVRILFLRFVW